jgi:hypothetical protein
LPDGVEAKLRFDSGQPSAYFSDKKWFCMVELEGVE